MRAGVLPEDKKALIDALHSHGGMIEIAGDGVNDALALTPLTWASPWALAPMGRWTEGGSSSWAAN